MFDFGFSEEDDRYTGRLETCLQYALVGGCLGLAFILGTGIKKTPDAVQLPEQLPAHLLIQGEVWNVKVVEQKYFALPNIVGLTDCERRYVFLSSSLHGSAQRSNLLHELFHAAVCTWNKTNGWYPNNAFYDQTPLETEAHPAIYSAEMALAPILQDNPHLATYLASQDPASEVQKLLDPPATKK